MADQRLRNKRELKHLFTNLRRKGIIDEMISILIDTLWRDRANNRTSGFRIRGGTDAVISIDPITRIFTIAPFDPKDENYQPRYGIFVWNNVAVLHRIYDIKTIEIPDEEGLFCIYFDKEEDPGTAQILKFIKNPSQQQIKNIVENKVLISFLYWNATNQEFIHFGDDRHGSEWNPQIHNYLHSAFGARRKSGLQFSGHSLNGDGYDNAHAKFSIIGGVMLHDDFELTIPSSSDSIPVLYRFGELPRYLANSGYAFVKGASRVYYNFGMINLAQAASGNYVLYHIFATNEILTTSRKIISVMGIAEYTNLADAYKGAEPELDQIVTYMPQQGRCYLGSIILQTSDDYTNGEKARIVALTGNEKHPPVTIAENSKALLEITGKQELSIPGEFEADEFYALKNRIWQKISEDGSIYDWNLHSPEQIIGYLPEPSNIVVNVDGIGTIDEIITAGAVVVTAINEAGETTGTNIPAFDILTDTTEALISWDEIEGATGYRVYYSGSYLEVAGLSIDFLDFTPDTPAALPLENTAAIFQNSFIVANDDTVQFIGDGIDIESAVDELDATKKIITLKKQQSSWTEENPASPNYIPGKPEIPANTDEKVKFDAADPTAGYLSEKIIAGTNITISEGTGADENKLKITATGSGGTREYIVYNETELIAAWTDARLDTTKSAIIYIGASITLTANRAFLISDPSHAWIEFRAISGQNINIQSYIFSINRVTCRDLGFRTNVQTYVTVDGHYANFYNCAWADEGLYSATFSNMKIAIKLKGTIDSNTGKIQLENPKHLSSTSYAINTGNIQPFIIQNTTAGWFGTNQQMYIEIQRFDSVLSFTRFSKVLLHSIAGSVPYKVTGDLTWYYHADQKWAGTFNIHSSSELLKQGSIDDLRADYIPSDTIVQILGITSAGLIRKMSGVSASFTTADGKTVTVVNGIVTNVV